MHNMLLIARREYVEKIRGRAFRFSTVLVPGLMILMMTGSYFSSRSLGVGRHVVVAASNPSLAAAVRDRLLEDKRSRLNVEVLAPATDEERSTLTQEVKTKALDSFLWIDTQPNGSLQATDVSGSIDDGGMDERLKTALNRVALEERLAAIGMQRSEIDALLNDVKIESIRLDSFGRTSRGGGLLIYGKTMLEIFLLTMPILLYGMDMARSIIEEKSSRIFEVMLAVVSPGDLLTGKLIGIGAVGLTQIAIWVAAAGALSGTTLAGTMLQGNFSIQFSWTEGVLFPIYFVLGFFLYSSLFSGLAATCETVQEFQMYAPLAILPTWFSFGILPLLVNKPNSPWAVGASLFPATSPFTMIPRVGLGDVAWWQIAGSVALLLLSIWAVLWFSSRLYRIGILMYGKRATLPEIVRWLRYS